MYIIIRFTDRKFKHYNYVVKTYNADEYIQVHYLKSKLLNRLLNKGLILDYEIATNML